MTAAFEDAASADSSVRLAIHGGAQVAELRAAGFRPEDIVDFSASVNPYGASPRVWQAMRAVQLDRYPDPDCTELSEALSQHLGRPTDWILPGNGATELIHAAARAWAKESGTVMRLVPSFGEYETAGALVRARPVVFPLNPLDGFDLDVPALYSAILKSQPSLLYLCNPNNPTGTYWSAESIEVVVQATSPGVVVLDEAYISFVSSAWSSLDLLDRCENLVILRSMTKDYGLTAARLGYAVGSPGLMRQMRVTIPAWSVNGLAQAAGLVSLSSDLYLRGSISRIARAKRGLVRGLRALGRDLLEGEANFVLLEVGDAQAVRQALLRLGLLVRDCTSFGLPRHIRIAVRRPFENRRLLTALTEVFDGDLIQHP